MNLSEFAQDGSILTEINMSPSSLRQLASNINATVGIEFEMIVRDAMSESSDDDDYELVPDYSENETVYSIDDIIEFFDDGDYNSRRDVNNLREELQNSYTEWVDESISDEWATSRVSYIKDWIIENASRDEIAEKLGIDVDDPEFEGVTRDQMQELAELISNEVDSLWYDSAYEAFREEKLDEDWGSETEFLRDQRIRSARDVENNYDITWPHWTTESNDEDREADGDRVASDFSRAIGREARFFRRYKEGDRGEQRQKGFYIVEPDGSLEPENDTDAGLEFVSPMLSLPDMLTELPKIIAWGKKNAYTSKGTECGLHMNVSIKGVNQESQLDYVKLALLLGDQYVLREFDRIASPYCKSAFARVQSNTKMLTPEKITEIMVNMRQGLNKLASQVIHSGHTEKMISINNKGKYIEFRSPGGDWLEQDLSKLINTLLRFVVAYDAATDENKYKKEYATKLEALISGGKKTVQYYDPRDKDNDKEPVKFSNERKKGWVQVVSPASTDTTNTVRYFAQWRAGLIPDSALVSFVRQARMQRKGADPTEGMPTWMVSSRNDQYQTFVKAADKAGAIEAARQTWNLTDPMSRSMYSDASFTAVQRNAPTTGVQQNAPIQARVTAGPAEPAFPGSTQDLQQRRAAAAQSQVANGQVVDWKIVVIPAEGSPHIIHILRDIGPNQGDANRAAATWLLANRATVTDQIRGAEITVLPVRVPTSTG